jgi:hypothetical protein
MEAMNSSRSCPAGSNLRPFKSQEGAFDEFPMSSSKQSSSIDKGNGVGSSISFSELIPDAMSWAILPLLVSDYQLILRN